MRKAAYICVYRLVPALPQPASNQAIAEKIGYSKSTVEGTISDLKNAGLIGAHGKASERILYLIGEGLSDEEVKKAVVAVTYRENVYSVNPKPETSPRKCLSCPATFESEGIHNRLCEWCRRTVGAVEKFVA